MLTTLSTDLRFAARVLRKSPLFTVVAAFCIALGSGAVTTIFSALNALVLRPLPGIGDTEHVVRIERIRPDGEGGFLSASYPLYRHLRDKARSLDVAAYSKVALTLSTGDQGTSAYGNLVSANFFSVLGVRPALGRFFLSDEGVTEGTHPVIVVSHSFWKSRLGADSAAVGRTLLVNGNRFTLVGVAPPAFQGMDVPLKTDAWVPVTMRRQLVPRVGDLSAGGATWIRMSGRLKGGASADVARRELVALTAAFASDGREPAGHAAFTDFRISEMTALPPDTRGPLSGFLAILLAAAGLVLLIASVNVASMLSARAIARRREMAVRAALGARRARLVGQLLTEVVLLFLLGAVGGIVLAVLATGALERLPMPSAAGALALSLELSPDFRVLAFALLVSLVTGIVFGTAPALRAARKDIAMRLRADGQGPGARRTTVGNGLIVAQLGLSLVLLVAAGLFLRALERGQGIDPGFDNAEVAVASMSAESWGYDEAKQRAFFGALREEVASLPGVTAVSYAMRLPLTMHSSGDNIEVDGAGAGPGRGEPGVPVSYMQVGADYFAALRLPVVSGEGIGRAHDQRAPKVAVVNETLAKRLWPDGSAVGRTFKFRGERVTIIGIARDAKYSSLTETTPPFVYLPLAQFWEPSQVLIARTTGGSEQLGPAIQRAVRSLDPALPLPTVTTLRRENAIVLLPQRVAAIVTGALGVVGLLLASVGLYGVIAYSTNRRTREIGVRMAVGARASDVLALVIRDGLRLAAMGIALGLVLAGAATRLIAGFLFGVNPLDAFTFAAMSMLFVVVAAGASYLPARRAAAADPVVALRTE
jgi:putative ABC transport system permease protein